MRNLFCLLLLLLSINFCYASCPSYPSSAPINLRDSLAYKMDATYAKPGAYAIPHLFKHRNSGGRVYEDDFIKVWVVAYSATVSKTYQEYDEDVGKYVTYASPYYTEEKVLGFCSYLKTNKKVEYDYCEKYPDSNYCKPKTFCEENPDDMSCKEEPDSLDWSRVLSNQRDMLSNQETIKNNQSSFLDISNLAKDNLTANQQGLIDSSNDIIQNQSQVHSELINSSNSIIQKQLEIKNGQEDIVSDLQQFNLKTAQKQGFISNQIDSVKQSGTDKLDATKAITETLNANHTDWIDLINEPSPTTPQQHFDNGVDLLSSVGDDAAAQELSSLDGVIDDLTKGPAGGGSSPIKDGAVLPWQKQLNKYIPEASSCDLSLPNPITGGSIAFNTNWSDKLKSILAWVISFYTFLSLFEILFTPVSPKN